MSAAFRAHVPSARRIAVALSGGRDSIALLDAAHEHARAHGLTLVALHIHHGLSPNAEHWAATCARLGRQRGIDCFATRVTVPRRARTSVEAEARKARYRALADSAHAQAIDVVLLAHHADDQAETVLLQLARGAGPHGLAAMPVFRDDDGLKWLRPLLEATRADIDEYVRVLGLEFIDDESNVESRFRRNALRRDVVPALRAHIPAYPHTVARAAVHQGEAAFLADELARIDAGGAFDGVALDCAALARLPPPRARNLLRWFLRQHDLVPPSLARLTAMLAQLIRPRRDACIDLRHAGARIGVFRGRIFVHPPAPHFRHVWRGESTVDLPHGVLRFVRARGAGLGARALAAAETVVRPRSGGERIQIAANRPRRALSAWLSEAGLASWDRACLPLVFCGDALAAVPGLGVDVTFAAAAGHDGWLLVWEPQRRHDPAPPPQPGNP